MAAMTLEQQKAIALAEARLRLRKQQESKVSAQRQIADDDITRSATEGSNVNPYLRSGAELLTGATGLLRGAMNIAGKPFQDEGEKPLGEQILPPVEERGSALEIAGSFADPLAWAIGGGVSKAAAKFLERLVHSSPAGQQFAQQLASKWWGRAAGRAGEGAVAGGTIGAVSEQGDTGTGAVVGGAVSAALPPAFNMAAQGVRRFKDAIKPTPGALAVKAAGDKTDDVIDAMMRTNSTVPGQQLTPGQAALPANSAEFAALERHAAERFAPSRFFGPKGSDTVYGRQELARSDVLSSIAKTPKILESAIKRRTTLSERNYEDAFKEVVKRDAGLRDLWKNNPYFRDELADAFKIAKGDKKLPITKNLTEFLHSVKLGMDAQLQRATNPNAPAISNATKRQIVKAKEALLDWLETRNDLYKVARLKHEAASKPINQMKLGQELQRSLEAPVTGAERAASFGAAKRKAEQVVSKATGKPRIEDLTPRQQRALDAIEENLKMDAEFETLAKEGMQSMKERIGAWQAPSPGVFQPLLSASRQWLNRLLNTGHENALRQLAPLMERNPQAFAQLMRAASPQQRQVVNSMLGKYVTRGAIAGGAQQGGDKEDGE